MYLTNRGKEIEKNSKIENFTKQAEFVKINKENSRTENQINESETSIYGFNSNQDKMRHKIFIFEGRSIISM